MQQLFHQYKNKITPPFFNSKKSLNLVKIRTKQHIKKHKNKQERKVQKIKVKCLIINCNNNKIFKIPLIIHFTIHQQLLLLIFTLPLKDSISHNNNNNLQTNLNSNKYYKINSQI